MLFRSLIKEKSCILSMQLSEFCMVVINSSSAFAGVQEIFSLVPDPFRALQGLRRFLLSLPSLAAASTRYSYSSHLYQLLSLPYSNMFLYSCQPSFFHSSILECILSSTKSLLGVTILTRFIPLLYQLLCRCLYRSAIF